MVAPAQALTLDDWLVRLETLHPKKIDLGLERLKAVLHALGIAEPPYRVITVAGTNGKGSCAALLESIYRQAGYRVGAFTSPHLVRFNERVRLDGSDAGDAELVELFEIIEAARGPITLSYFEYTAAAAFLLFARAKADIAVLEVGMGGRLDAVNALDADASLIVSIDLDHQHWLGVDRESIGREKAGVMRFGRPAVVADRDPPRSVLQHAEAVGASLKLIGRDFDFEPKQEGMLYREGSGLGLRLPVPPFGSDVQRSNAAACAAVVQGLQPLLPVSEDALRRGIASASLRARFERQRVGEVEWVFDVAHNPAATRRLLEALGQLPSAARTLAVVGMMADKDVREALAPFASLVDEWHVAAIESQRGASPQALIEVLASLGAGSAYAHASAGEACAAAASRAGAGHRVLVFGSFYTVGPALAALGLYCAASDQGDLSAKWTGV